MRFETGFGLVKDDPSAGEVGLLLAELPGGDGSYAILRRDDAHFLQAARGAGEEWVVEYHDGADHCTAFRQPLDVIISLFQLYQQGLQGWRSLVQWKPIPLRRLSAGLRFGPARAPQVSAPLAERLQRAALLVIAYGGGSALLVLGFVPLARALHLETEAAIEVGAGVLFVFICVAGFFFAQDKRESAPVAFYLALCGLVLVGVGGYRQRQIARARARCAQEMAEAKDVHQRRATLVNGVCRDLDEGRIAR